MNLKKLLPTVIFFLCFALCAHAETSAASPDETYDKLRLMVDIMEIINTSYVEPTETKDLVTGSIIGMMRSLDPFSEYMDEKAFKDMKNFTEGSYSGVGLRIMTRQDALTVITPMLGTPAYTSGILPDDIIVKIDGTSTENMSSDEAVNLMRGKANTKVTLTIAREGEKEPLEFVLVRKKIKIETINKLVLDGNIIYIKLSEFNVQSAKDLEKAITETISKKITPRGIILDLRNNPGGVLESAIDILSLFLSDAVEVLSTKGRTEETRHFYYSKGSGKFAQIPLVILVNRGSASASEIVAGTLQDLKRALIIGENSFGKGSVQTVLPLSDGSALRLTIAKYYLPSGRPIIHSENKNEKSGITPDIEIKISREDEVKLYTQIQEMFEGGIRKPKTDAPKVEDLVLNKAVEIIKEGRVTEEIEKSTAGADKENGGK
jgi:carboxyl-terminal processing protease